MTYAKNILEVSIKSQIQGYRVLGALIKSIDFQSNFLDFVASKKIIMNGL
jgi:hypothetical protein